MNLLVFVLAATLFRAEPTNGTVDFSIMKWGVLKEEGTFRDFHANIHFDRKDVTKSRVDFEVQAASIDTKNKDRDGTLRSEDFFHVARHPKLTFRSTRVVPRGNHVADVTGDLTIRGVTRRITVPVRLLGVTKNGDREIAGFETSFTIDRRHFGITGGRWAAGAPGILGTNVTVHIVAGGMSK